MKNLIYLLLIVSAPCFGQTKKEVISKKLIGPVDCTYERHVDLEKNDTIVLIFLGFQDKTYTVLTEYALLGFQIKDSSGVEDFIKDFSKCLNNIDQKSDLSWDRDKYRLRTYGDGTIYLYALGKYDGYTTLNKRQSEKLIAWFSENGFFATP